MKNKAIKISALVASFLIVALAAFMLNLGGNTALAKVYAIVTVDINPSVEIQVDEENKVLKVSNVNDDAINITSDDMVGMDIEDALEILLENAVNEGYLLDKGSVLISSVIIEKIEDDETQDEETDEEDTDEEDTDEEDTDEEDIDEEDTDEDSLEQHLEKFMEKKAEQYDFLYAKGTEDALRAAKSQGLSLGKYQMLKFLDDDITQEEIREMKVAEIAARKEIRALEKAEKKELKIISKIDEKEIEDEEKSDDISEEVEKVIIEDSIQESSTVDAIPINNGNSDTTNNSKNTNNKAKEKDTDKNADKNIEKNAEKNVEKAIKANEDEEKVKKTKENSSNQSENNKEKNNGNSN